MRPLCILVVFVAAISLCAGSIALAPAENINFFYLAVPSPYNADSGNTEAVRGGSTDYQLLIANRDHVFALGNRKVRLKNQEPTTVYFSSPGVCACKATAQYPIWEGFYGDRSALQKDWTDDQINTKIQNWKDNETFTVDIVTPSGAMVEMTSGVTLKGGPLSKSQLDAIMAGAWDWCNCRTGEALD